MVHLVVAPDKADYYRVLLPTLHAINSSDLHVFAVYWTQHGCEECDLRLVPEPSLSKCGALREATLTV